MTPKEMASTIRVPLVSGFNDIEEAVYEADQIISRFSSGDKAFAWMAMGYVLNTLADYLERLDET